MMGYSHACTFVAIVTMMLFRYWDYKIVSILIKGLVIPCTYGVPMVHLIYRYRQSQCEMNNALMSGGISSSTTYIHAMGIIEISYISCWLISILLWLIKYKFELKFHKHHNPFVHSNTTD